jgi:hypothetical protein
MILDCDGLMTAKPTSIVELAAAVAKTLIVNQVVTSCLRLWIKNGSLKVATSSNDIS